VVRAAAALVCLQGGAGGAAALVLVLRAVTGAGDLGAGLAAAGFLAGCAAALLLVGVALWRGAHGATTPAVVAQLLLLGIAWYAAGPSSQPEYGVPTGLYCAAVLVLLFSAPATRWNYGGDISGRRPAG
jgi:hypothetical protein